MLNIIRGTIELQEQANELTDKLKAIVPDGTAYIGFTLPSTQDSERSVDVLLIGKKCGLVLFTIVDMSVPKDGEFWRLASEDVDQLHFIMTSFLMQNVQLRDKRSLALKFNSVAVVGDLDTVDEEYRNNFADLETLDNYLAQTDSVPENLWAVLNSVLDNVTQIKPPKKRPKAKTEGSLGTIMKAIERQIANMDAWQRKAALEIPDGPQRIRGLAGSGKTVVLARKAALLHRMHRDWDIVVTFHTRSLYQQFIDLIRRFSYEYIRDEPDWAKLRVMHAWGAYDRPGVYKELAERAGLVARDFGYASAVYGSKMAFAGICDELLSAVKSRNIEPIFDAVLIDEAQDLPPSFFQLLLDHCRDHKRIVWAYDEMQNLLGDEMPALATMFGVDENGNARVSLQSQPDEADRDLVLPVCYRNTPWAISMAHSLGMGVFHSSGKLIQHFRDPDMWLRNGYRIVSGTLKRGKKVCLERDPQSYPEYFLKHLNPESSIIVKEFQSKSEQYDWVAQQIQSNLVSGELEFDDILVVFLLASTAKKQAAALQMSLNRLGIRSHLAGVNTSPDEVYKSDSIAMANIFRAKGNEAAMIYVVDAQDCAGPLNREAKRNALFTAITRSRAWVNLCGCGTEMSVLAEEIRCLRTEHFKLRFKVPTQQEQDRMHSLHSEDTAGVTRARKQAQDNAQALVDLFREGAISFGDLPKDIQQELRLYTSTGEVDENEDV